MALIHPLDGPAVFFEIKNKQPLDLLEVATSLKAFGEQFKRHAAREYPGAATARLAIGTLETGSIIAKLIPLLELADTLVGHRDLVGPFVAQFGDTINLIRSFPPKARDLPKPDVRAAKEVVKPIAGDTGAQINIWGAEGATIVTNVYNIGSAGARDLRRHADIILAGLPAEEHFDAEPMVLHQVRDGPAASAGDYGFIDRFSGSPVKIRWLSEDVKAAVLDRAENVFDLVYFVSGQARRAGGSIVAYEVRRLVDVALRPPDQRHGY